MRTSPDRDTSLHRTGRGLRPVPSPPRTLWAPRKLLATGSHSLTPVVGVTTMSPLNPFGGGGPGGRGHGRRSRRPAPRGLEQHGPETLTPPAEESAAAAPEAWLTTVSARSLSGSMPGSGTQFRACSRGTGPPRLECPARGTGERARAPAGGTPAVLRQPVHRRLRCEACRAIGRGAGRPGRAGGFQPLLSVSASVAGSMSRMRANSLSRCPR